MISKRQMFENSGSAWGDEEIVDRSNEMCGAILFLVNWECHNVVVFPTGFYDRETSIECKKREGII